jgi:arsenate reductase
VLRGMSEERRYNVLFLCTGNSARSILAEAYLNNCAGNRFRAFSAGSHPKGAIHPITLDTLGIAHLPIAGLRSKSWDEFAEPDAPKMDFLITLCDSAAGEVCPVWPGQPITAHWSFPDPAALQGREVEQRAFFLDIFRQICTRLDIFRNLPLPRLGRLVLKHELDAIGRTPG